MFETISSTNSDTPADRESLGLTPWDRQSCRGIRPRFSGRILRTHDVDGTVVGSCPEMKLTHRRLFRINDKIQRLEREIALAEAELEYHRSINDDAQRDALVGNYIDREEAGATAADVKRFEKTISALQAKRGNLVAKRDRLLSNT